MGSVKCRMMFYRFGGGGGEGGGMLLNIFEHLTLGPCSGQERFNSLLRQRSPRFHQILDLHQRSVGISIFLSPDQNSFQKVNKMGVSALCVCVFFSVNVKMLDFRSFQTG